MLFDKLLTTCRESDAPLKASDETTVAHIAASARMSLNMSLATFFSGDEDTGRGGLGYRGIKERVDAVPLETLKGIAVQIMKHSATVRCARDVEYSLKHSLAAMLSVPLDAAQVAKKNRPDIEEVFGELEKSDITQRLLHRPRALDSWALKRERAPVTHVDEHSDSPRLVIPHTRKRVAASKGLGATVSRKRPLRVKPRIVADVFAGIPMPSPTVFVSASTCLFSSSPTGGGAAGTSGGL